MTFSEEKKNWDPETSHQNQPKHCLLLPFQFSYDDYTILHFLTHFSSLFVSPFYGVFLRISSLLDFRTMIDKCDLLLYYPPTYHKYEPLLMDAFRPEVQEIPVDNLRFGILKLYELKSSLYIVVRIYIHFRCVLRTEIIAKQP